MAVPPFDYDAALLACAAGDQNAFQNLYRHEAPRMLALGLKMLSQRATAEDLVRDAFILIWKNASSYDPAMGDARAWMYRSEEHTSELQSLMRISYAVFCLKKKIYS